MSKFDLDRWVEEARKIVDWIWADRIVALGNLTDSTAKASTDIVTWCIVTDLWITYPYKK